jgi:hypothetical protein
MTGTDLHIMTMCQELEAKRKRAVEKKGDATLEDIFWSIKNELDIKPRATGIANIIGEEEV